MAGQLPPPRPVNDEDGDDLLIPLVSGVQELLFAPVNPFNNRPGFVAGPTPETGLGRAVQGITRLNCRLWARRDKTNFSGRVNAYNGEVCGPYLDELGENPDPGSVAPPFRGGQCNDVYLVAYTAKSDFGGTLAATVRARGPIGGVRTRIAENGARLVELFCRNLDAGSATCGPLGDAPAAWRVLSSFGNAGDPGTVKINSVSPCGLDNCGDPPTLIQPPATVTPVAPIVPTINIDLPGVGPININIDLDDKGRPVLCAPDVETCITIDPTFGGGGDGGGGSGGPPPGDVGDPGTPEATGEGGEAAGQAPPGSILVGLRVDLLTASPKARQYAPGVYRAAAYIYMGTFRGLDQDYAGSMLTDGQFIFAEKENLTHWRVRANTNYNWLTTPYYREATQ